MNRLSRINRLRNRYFAIRHGESEANLISLVCGDPRVGCERYGLTPNSIEQIRGYLRKFEKTLNNDTLVFSSDFLRTRQTAGVVADFFNIPSEKIVLEKRLRERFFGEYEGRFNFDYKVIYEQERKGELNSGVETVGSVLLRTSQMIADLEKTYENKKIVLVSHGDPLTILQTAFIGINPLYYKVFARV